MNLLTYRSRLPKVAMIIAGFAALSVIFINVPTAFAQTCANPNPPTTYGQVKQSVNVTTAGTYRVWSRIKAPNATNNSYFLQIGTGCPIVVGDSSTIGSNWQWVDYRDNNAASHINVTLGVGTYQLTYTGREADVQLDRVLLLSDGCTPSQSGNGDDCASADTVKPTASITAPAANTSVKKGNPVTINATAQDNLGVNKVEFLVDGVVVGNVPGTAGTTSYTYTWDSSAATVAAHNLTVKAYDAAGNVGPSTAVPITITPASGTGDTTPPTITTFSINPPSVLTGSSVTATATATDTVGVTKVEFIMDGTIVGTDTTAPYSATWSPTVVGLHSVIAKAYDAAGNTKPSNPANLTVTSNSTLKGDIDGDRHVNSVDFGVVAGHIGQNYAPADIDKDGTVGVSDLSILLANWTW